MQNRNPLKIFKIIALSLFGVVCGNVQAQDEKPVIEISGLIEFTNNGGWSWFNGEGIIIHDNKIFISSVAHGSGEGGSSLARHVRSSVYDLDTEQSTTVSLGVAPGGHSGDDHDQGAFLPLDDGNYLAVYTGHGADRNMYWVLGDGNSWSDPQKLDVGAANTYTNLYRLGDENNGAGLIYNFHRGIGYNPNAMISEDNGNSWKYGGRLFNSAGRPYVRYTSNNKDEIHFINTEQHPRDFDNSIYHGYIKGGKTYKSDGTVLDENFFDGSGVDPVDLGMVYQGNAANVAWTSDVALDTNGNPFCVFSVQKDSEGLPRGEGGEDHRYHYARWNGSEWIENEIAFGGSKLYSGEDDYTGNIALDPDNPWRVFISADVDPVTGDPLISSADNQRHYEIFMGISEDSGVTFSWTPLTENSSEDNLRPQVPHWNTKNTAVVFMQGKYSTYSNYQTRIVGFLIKDSIPVVNAQTHPANSGQPAFSVIQKQGGYQFYVAGEVGISGELLIRNLQGAIMASLPLVNSKALWSSQHHTAIETGQYIAEVSTDNRRHVILFVKF